MYLPLCDIVSQSGRFELVIIGVAIATTIGNMIACIVYASYFFKKGIVLSICPADFRSDPRLVWDVISI